MALMDQHYPKQNGGNGHDTPTVNPVLKPGHNSSKDARSGEEDCHGRAGQNAGEPQHRQTCDGQM